ncbi:hypothetical protein OS493_033121 [Desmophyllum pertusum]|uniref:Uncharacterized protein n=1 Tax=Desmophyllum pertusum TaxID=174260 RepID=A0A9W9YX49_9CNID|nr:hypothetical protein OS493_033121 [Desmophyllum pertusum]
MRDRVVDEIERGNIKSPSESDSIKNMIPGHDKAYVSLSGGIRAVDEDDMDNFHLRFEQKETEALVLNTGVLESLQSTCDASDVVARLQDNLQLNQAALAAPEPETTRMIRCLATIAKNENRLDVVQHLRQITPAGTTGPLLPERLDVRKIPQSQMTELTFKLSGGEEWKLAAEKLGFEAVRDSLP